MVLVAVVVLAFIALVAHVFRMSLEEVRRAHGDGRDWSASHDGDPTEIIEATGAAVTAGIREAIGPINQPEPAASPTGMAELLALAGAEDIELTDEPEPDWTEDWIPPVMSGPGAIAVDARGKTVYMDADGEVGEHDV